MRGSAKAIIGVLVSVLLLWWALRDVSLSELRAELAEADLLLLALAIAVATVGFAVRALRWGILLAPIDPDLPLRPRFAATTIGFAANNLLPARVGEFARALSLSRLSKVPTAAAFGSLALERILDAVVLAGLLFGVMALPSFPASSVVGIDPRTAALVVAAGLGAVGVALFVLATAPERSARWIESGARFLPARARRAVVDAMHAFVGGLGVLRSPRLFLLSLAWAVGQWIFLSIPFYLGFRAFGIDQVPFTGAIFLNALIAFAVAIPSSPGFFGPFEAAATIGLGLWDVPKEKAVSFAVGFHLGSFVPVTVIGLYYVWRLGLRWTDVRHSEEVVETAVEREDEGAGTAGTQRER